MIQSSECPTQGMECCTDFKLGQQFAMVRCSFSGSVATNFTYFLKVFTGVVSIVLLAKCHWNVRDPSVNKRTDGRIIVRSRDVSKSQNSGQSRRSESIWHLTCELAAELLQKYQNDILFSTYNFVVFRDLTIRRVTGSLVNKGHGKIT